MELPVFIKFLHVRIIRLVPSRFPVCFFQVVPRTQFFEKMFIRFHGKKRVPEQGTIPRDALLL